MNIWLSYLKDIVVIVTGIGTLIIASIGVSSWRTKLKGEKEFDLERNVLIELYKTIEMIRQYRKPYFSKEEYKILCSKMNQENTDIFLDPHLMLVFEQYNTYLNKLSELKAFTGNYDIDVIEDINFWTFMSKIEYAKNISRFIKSEQNPERWGILSGDDRKDYEKKLEYATSILKYSNEGKNDEFEKEISEYYSNFRKKIDSKKR